MKPKGVYLAIALAILCMSTASIMIRWCSAPPLIVAMYRVIFTAILAVPLGGRDFRSSLKNISRGDLIYIAGAGFFLALHFSFWITSLDYT
ncbi:MAG: EamA/RhaT family transporter, partial [Syntrophomonadaceae bacterium]|nr:EamA/RhaT family transporter [Syntrophomonadaceae bacterium]